MLAHTHRALTGQGQQVDVSCQQAVARTLAHAPQQWDVNQVLLKRMGVYRQTSGDNVVRVSWPCKDGYINHMAGGGGSSAASTRALLTWMDEEGMGDEYLNSVNWEDLGYGEMRAELMVKLIDPLERFFSTHTKAELVEGSMERRILMFPVSTPKDILAHPHLAARGYFEEIHHDELDATFTYPGPFVKAIGGARLGPRRRPPLIGEHNDEIYQGELGLSLAETQSLRSEGVI